MLKMTQKIDRGNVYLGGLAAGVILLSGCQTTLPISEIPEDRRIPNVVTELKVKPGDALKVSFPGVETLGFEHVVRPDGKISLPENDLMELDVRGKAPKAVEEELTELYRESLAYEQVDIQFQPAPEIVRVTGAVLSPGPIPITEEMTALEAVMAAGGVVESQARLDQVRLTALEGGVWQTYILDLKSAMDPSKERRPFYLKPGDSIVVPQRRDTLF